MNDIFEKIQNDFNEFMKQAKELVEKERVAEASKTKRWKPKDGDCVYFINDNGDLEDGTYIGEVDELALKIGNCFKTKEEAQKERDRRIAEQELLDMADGSLNGRWYEIEYIPKEDCFDYCEYSEISSSCYRFASKESARKAIDTLGTERLKLIFRID